MSTDNPSRKDNAYYIYQLNNPDDWLADTFQRRLSKCELAQNKGFLFNLFEMSTLFKKNCEFIDQFGSPDDAIIINFPLFKENTDFLLSFIEKKQFSVFLVVAAENEWSEVQRVLEMQRFHIVFQPSAVKESYRLQEINERLTENFRQKVSFLPRKFDNNLGQKVCAVDYLNLLKSKNLLSLPRNSHIPFWNHSVDHSYELEPLVEVTWSTICSRYEKDQVAVSVIVPTFNNSRFLVNVISHLADQLVDPETFEILIVDDGSVDSSLEIVKKFVQSHKLNINLQYIYWSKKDSGRGPQNFFRAGLARNLAARYAIGEFLVFLDSDMLVPPKFIGECQHELKKHDLIQFQRFHIKQSLSLTNPRWKDVVVDRDCYIEEKHYWSRLFNCEDWDLLPEKWKYVCTYALGIRRDEFFKLGRFKRHFISYGFEDTDLGFRMYKQKKKFKLVKTPLLHLTNYSQMQYQNSSFKRHELLSVTAKLFFLDHLDLEIGITLRTFLGGEKGLIDRIKDHFLNN